MPDVPDGDDWIQLSAEPLAVAVAAEWVVQPGCGASVVFTGTVRDHAEGRPGVSRLEYEAYEARAMDRMGGLVDEARRRWPSIGRVACLHRVGELLVGDPAVVVAVSTPHRAEAFAAAAWCIDTLKATVPIWKLETWDGGRDWGTGAESIQPVGSRPVGSGVSR